MKEKTERRSSNSDSDSCSELSMNSILATLTSPRSPRKSSISAERKNLLESKPQAYGSTQKDTENPEMHAEEKEVLLEELRSAQQQTHKKLNTYEKMLHENLRTAQQTTNEKFDTYGNEIQTLREQLNTYKTRIEQLESEKNQERTCCCTIM